MPVPSSFDIYEQEQAVRELQGFDRIWYQCKAQPLVPIGCLLTTGALVASARAIRSGQSAKANRMFTARVVFQGLTIAALVAGSVVINNGPQESEAEREARKSEMRKKLWLEELEMENVR
ncbi:hypoxia induced protein conserved region-domain-containing protein, partial [Dipodascopsis tothii]|uniref:hypoxia induced protein conserved region-domain-containing protein n=1 Tax=Dipodascopsis tothii TaxID=44089 RepID=UPI0034CDC689